MAPAMLAWWAFLALVVQGRPMGSNPPPVWLVVALWLLIGMGLPALFGQMRLFIEVTPDAVLVRYRPFSRRSIPIADIQKVEARTYEALREYGGWGIRGWSKEKMAYNVSGNKGVELTLRDGRSLMLGSQRADELAAAVEDQRQKVRLKRAPAAL